MADILHKNVCLVCGEILEDDAVSRHLVQHVGHVTVECIVRAQGTPAKIAINTRIDGSESLWAEQCKNIDTRVTQQGSLYFSEPTCDVRRMVNRTVEFKEAFSTAPVITLSNQETKGIMLLQVSSITAQGFTLKYVVRPLVHRDAELSLDWEAKYDG